MQIHESAQVILIDQQRFAPRFYESLFRDHPETERYFSGVDMPDQRTKLMSALITAERHATTGGWVSENFLAALGRKHLALGVGREMFSMFVDTLIGTLEEHHGSEWTSTLEAEWRRAMDSAVEVMLRQYPERKV